MTPPKKHNSFFIAILSIFLLLLSQHIVHAQEGKQDASALTAIQLPPDKIKAVEGYYRNRDNQEMYVQFAAAENSLSAKLLWNNKQLKLYPSSETEYFSKEGETVTIKFVKGQDGVVTQFLLNGNNNNQWDKVKEYKPVTHKEITHTPDQLKVFEGLFVYHNEPTRFVEFSVKDNKLILKQHWDGEKVSFVPESELDFFCPDQPMFIIKFTKDSIGAISQMLAFKRDLWDKVKPVQLSADQMRAFTGKFRFKDDHDNVILISIKGNGLVLKQLWDGKEITMSPRSAVYFYNDEQSFPALFMKEKDGSVSKVMVLGEDVFERMKD
jgi:hypothetical protein